MAFSDICKIYPFDGKYVVLNPLVPSWLVTNVNGVLLLKLYAEDKSFDEIADAFQKLAPDFPRSSAVNFLNYAREEGLFEIPAQECTYTPENLREICLNITDTCNLRCVYCIVAQRVEGEKFMSLDDYKNLLDEAAAINPKMSVLITGGEPLTSNLTLPVARYARELGFTCGLLTNGTLVTEKNVDELTAVFENFSISIDGSTAEIHDYYRGAGNFARAKRGVELLISRGANVAVAMVVNRKNMHNVPEAVKLWGKRLLVQPLFPFGNDERYDELCVTGREYYETLANVPELVPYVRLLPAIKFYRNERKLSKCGMGDRLLSISRSGNVYPCNNLHAPKYKLGNLFEQSLSEIYNSAANEKIKRHTVNNVDKCRDCDFKLICGGSCRSRNFCENGDLDICSGFCEYDKNAILNGMVKSAHFQEL